MYSIKTTFVLLVSWLLMLWGAPQVAQAQDYDYALSAGTAIDQISVAMGQSTTLAVTLINKGRETITNVGYTCEYLGVVTNHTYQLPQPFTPQAYAIDVELPITAPQQTGQGTLKVSITHVNGKPNPISVADRTMNVNMTVLSKLIKRMVVVEDYTGTWCPYCAEALDALEVVNREFKGRVIPLAIHHSAPGRRDVMGIQASEPLRRAFAGGYPTVRVNRIHSSRVVGTLLKDVQKALNTQPEATVQITKAALNSMGTKVVIDARAIFNTSRAKVAYRLAYMLVADGLKGTGAAWAQKDARGPIRTNQVFNHTVVRTTSAPKGEEGSLPSRIEENKAYDHSHTFDISNTKSEVYADEELIQDKKKLSAVVLLINSETNDIVNAAILPVSSTPDEGYRVNLGEDGIATLATPHTLTVPAGAKASAVVQGPNGELQLHPVATEGQHLPAGVGVVIEGKPNTILALPTAPNGASTVSMPAEHLLQPATSTAQIWGNGHKLYILARDATWGLGFYWQAGTQGNWVSNIAGRAYLRLPEPQAHTQGYALQAGLLTGIDTAPHATVAPTTPLYDLSGRRVAQPTQHGIYIGRGQKIVR